jgi:hypothetical protein
MGDAWAIGCPLGKNSTTYLGDQLQPATAGRSVRGNGKIQELESIFLAPAGVIKVLWP